MSSKGKWTVSQPGAVSASLMRESRKLAFQRDLLFLTNYEEKGIRVGDIFIVLKLHKKGCVRGFLPFLSIVMIITNIYPKFN